MRGNGIPPARVSPCVLLFVESLLSGVDEMDSDEPAALFGPEQPSMQRFTSAGTDDFRRGLTQD